MVIDFIIAISEKVGGTDVSQGGEMLGRSNLMDSEEYNIL